MKISLSLLFSFLFAATHAQLWEKTFGLPINLNLSSQTAFDFKHQVGGGLYYSETILSNRHLVALDSQGDTLWRNRVELDTIAGTLFSENYTYTNGQHHIFGSLTSNFTTKKLFYLRFNSNGLLNQKYYIPVDGNLLHSYGATDSQGNFYASYLKDSTTAVNSTDPDTTRMAVYLQKRNSNGNLLWQKVFRKDSIYSGSLLPNTFAYTIPVLSPNDELYFSYLNPFCIDSSFYLKKYSAQGALLYSVNVNSLSCSGCFAAIYGILPDQDSTCLVSTYDASTYKYFYLHLSKTGALLDSLAIQSPNTTTNYYLPFFGGNKKMYLPYLDSDPIQPRKGILVFDSLLNYNTSLLNIIEDSWFTHLIDHPASRKNQYGIYDAYLYGNGFKVVSADSLLNVYPNAAVGSIILDLNSNCSADISDYAISNKAAVLTNSLGQNWIGISDNSGAYKIKIPNGTYTLSHNPDDNKAMFCPANTSSFVFSSVSSSQTINIFDTISLNKTDAQSLIAVEPLYFSMNNYIYGVYENIGSTVTNVTLTVIKDPALTFSNSTQTPTSINGDSVRFVFNSVPPCSKGIVGVSLSPPANMQIGTSLKFRSIVSTSLPDWNLNNNSDSVMFSYFGQLKLSQPTSTLQSNYLTVNRPLDVTGDESLVYMIHFQNPLTTSVSNLYISQTLSNYLNLETFDYLGSSHNFEVTIEKNQNLSFRSKNIILTDSNTNYSQSYGWILYSIKPKANWPANTTISNSAQIYFADHSALNTNSTQNKKLEVAITTGTSPAADATTIDIYPNPSTGKLTIQCPKEMNQVLVSDMGGRVLVTLALNGNSKYEFDFSQLAAGMYLLECKNNHQSLRKKILLK